METFSAQPQDPPKRKSKVQLFLLIGLIAVLAIVVILDALSFMGKIKLKELTDTTQSQESREVTEQAGNSNEAKKRLSKESTKKDYKSCFSKYDKKLLPQNIEQYSIGKSLLQDAPTDKSNFRVRDRVTSVNWGLHTDYLSSDKLLLDITIADLKEPARFSDFNDANQKIENLSVGITLGRTVNAGPQEGTTNISTIVPGTNTLIYFSFQKLEKKPKDIFSSWLISVC